MPEVAALTGTLLQGGIGNLAAYLAAHVLLCLLPAFLVAGGMAALIPQHAVTRFLGRTAPRAVSYPAAAAAGSVLAVCSCTIVPLFAGIYRKGAGLGPATTFLFFAPAANVLALVYTGGVIGVDLALARLALSLAFGIGIGLVMALLFRSDDAARCETVAFEASVPCPAHRAALPFLLALVALLLLGTLRLQVLTTPYLQFELSSPFAGKWQAALDAVVPHDASRGEEGISAHGCVMIVALLAIALVSIRGLESIHAGVNGWTKAALALIAATLLLAALQVEVVGDVVRLGVTGRFLGVAASIALLAHLARTRLPPAALRGWLWESWRLAKQIFPLLVAGVFVVGMLRVLIRPEWIEALAGTNSLQGNLAGVAFGVVMYFPTLVEVPIARMFLDLGMHRGPLLAYLMADPELSLQSILVIAAIVGKAKAWTYVALVAIFSTTAGLVYGAWVDGASPLVLASWVAGVMVALAALLTFANHRTPMKEARHAHD